MSSATSKIRFCLFRKGVPLAVTSSRCRRLTLLQQSSESSFDLETARSTQDAQWLDGNQISERMDDHAQTQGRDEESPVFAHKAQLKVVRRICGKQHQLNLPCPAESHRCCVRLQVFALWQVVGQRLFRLHCQDLGHDLQSATAGGLVSSRAPTSCH